MLPELPKVAESRYMVCIPALSRGRMTRFHRICVLTGIRQPIVVYTGSVFGMTDVTHLGLQDIPMLSNIPGLVYLAPTTKEEYLSMLDWSVEQKEMPVAIKLPGGDMISGWQRSQKDWSQLNTYEVTEKGSKIALIGLGTFYFLALQTAEMLEKKGIHATVTTVLYYRTG